MREMLLVARRELGAYFNSLLGYVVVAAVLALDGLLFNAFAVTDKARLSTDVVESFFYGTWGVTVTAAILLTMRLLAEERQTGTMVLLDASPLSEWQIVVGKYLSAVTVLAVMIALTLPMPALIMVNGKISGGHLVAGYLGLMLAASAVAALGTFASSLANSQLAAAVVAGGTVVFLIALWYVAKLSEPPLDALFAYTAIFSRHFQPFMKGQVPTESVVYHVALVFLFLTLAIRVMATRRWR